MQWIKKDEGLDTYTNIDGETSNTFKPSQVGTYAVRGTITCTGAVYQSSDVRLSICPKDFDNDGIIDNIDLDNDNDGILNSVESGGKGIFNLSDPANPTFSLESGKSSTVTITGTLTKESSVDADANSLSATATGVFESKLLGAETETNTYTINTTSKDSQNQDELLFFHATSDPKITHNIIDGESFIYRVLQSDKIIKVCDPDNSILIDTNLDGKYETNVVSWTAGEIHFKINPNPNP